MLSAICPRPPGRRENSLRKASWRTIQGSSDSFGAMVEYPNSSRDQSRFHQLGKKVLPGIFFEYEADRGGYLERRDIVVADLEELEKMDASEIHPRRINAKEVLTPQSWDEFIFPIADGAAKLSGRYQEFREPT